MLKYKIDVLATLKEAGYNTSRIRKEKLLSESVLQYIREGKMISTDGIQKLCQILHLQPGDIIEYIE
jgi:putative transcriptional regulator